MMNEEYEVIEEFECHGKQMVTVRIGNAAHVMSQEEWSKIFRRNHPEKRKTKIEWNRFVPKKQYNQNKASLND